MKMEITCRKALKSEIPLLAEYTYDAARELQANCWPWPKKRPELAGSVMRPN